MGVIAELNQFDAIERYLTLTQQLDDELNASFNNVTEGEQMVASRLKDDNFTTNYSNSTSVQDYLMEGVERMEQQSYPNALTGNSQAVFITDSNDGASVSPRGGSQSPVILDLDSIVCGDSIKEESFYDERLSQKSQNIDIKEQSDLSSLFNNQSNQLNITPNVSLTRSPCQDERYGSPVLSDGSESMDVQTPLSSPSCPSSVVNGEQSLYYNMMQEILEEMTATCSTLRIDADPRLWSADQVRQWIAWQCRKFNQRSPSLDFFMMSGVEFIQLTEEDFVKRAPAVGTILFHQLDIWRSAREWSGSMFEQTTSAFYTPSSNNSLQQQTQQTKSVEMGQIPVPCLSPTPSNTSDDSNYSFLSYNPASDEEYSSSSAPKVGRVEEHTGRQTIQLWQFLKQLLLQPQHYGKFIHWVDRSSGIFKIEKSSEVATLWGQRKKRPAMDYDKLSRSIRQYYKKGIIRKTENPKRLVYQFCSKYL